MSKPLLNKSQTEEVRSRIIGGEAVREIANSIGVRYGIIYHIFSKMRIEVIVFGGASNPIAVTEDFVPGEFIITDPNELNRVKHSPNIRKITVAGRRYIDMTEVLTKSIECSDDNFNYYMNYFREMA